MAKNKFDGSVKTGDAVKVKGTTSAYGLIKQFGQGATFEKTGTGSVSVPTATEITGAELDEYADATVEFKPIFSVYKEETNKKLFDAEITIEFITSYTPVGD